MDTILIIDDDLELLKLLEGYLAQFGLKAVGAARPSQGLKLLRQLSPALVILDVMLPEMDGFEVCKEIRKASRTPIIMLTARGEVSDRVVGLELGADDYLPKPFEPRELVARVQTVLRRRSPAPLESSSGRLQSGALRLDLGARQASLKGKALDLTTTELAVLSLLMERAGEPVDRDSILKRLHGAAGDAFDRSADLAVSRLRKKLGEGGREPRFIKTVWGSGYCFVGKVERHG